MQKLWIVEKSAGRLFWKFCGKPFPTLPLLALRNSFPCQELVWTCSKTRVDNEGMEGLQNPVPYCQGLFKYYDLSMLTANKLCQHLSLIISRKGRLLETVQYILIIALYYKNRMTERQASNMYCAHMLRAAVTLHKHYVRKIRMLVATIVIVYYCSHAWLLRPLLCLGFRR